MEEIKNIVFSLIRFKTTENNPEELKKIVEFVKDFFKNSGLYINEYVSNARPSLLITFKKEKNSKVLFVGHLDVVPADSEKQYEPLLKGDRIYGRGAMDMKGPCAVMLALFKNLSCEKRKGPWGLLLTTDEETGSKNGVQYVLEKKGLSPEFAIIPDGGPNFTTITQGKGVFHCIIKVRGKSTHGSTPWLGENAILKAFQIYKELEEWINKKTGNKKDREHWYPTLNLGKISGGQVVNKVPDYAEMHIDFRFIHPDTPLIFEKNIKKILSKYKGTEIIPLSRGSCIHTPLTNPYMQRFERIYRKVLKRKMKKGKEHGATDGRFFSERKIPVLTIYPAGGGIHSKDEWVSLSSLHTLYALFKEFLIE